MQNQLRRLSQFWTKNKPRLILGGFLGIALLSALLILSPANAAVDGDQIVRWIFVGLFGIIGTLANLLSQLFLSLINSVILPGQNSLIFGDQLVKVWSIMLDIANSLFFIALFVFAILIITRQAGYNFKKAITTLIVAVVTANLSLDIIRLLIEAGDALRNTASSLIPGTKPEELVTWFNGLLFGEGMAEIVNDAKTDTGRTILLSFGVMAAEIAIMIALFKLMGVLLERAIRLAILAIFAPVQVAISILPQKELQSMGGSWLSDTIKWVLVLPIAFVLIGVARMIMPSDTAESVKSFLQHIADPANPVGSIDTNFPGTLFLIIIGIGTIIAAGNSASLLKLPVGAATKFFSDMASGAINPVKKFASNAAKAPFVGAGKMIGTAAGTKWEGFKQNTKLGRWGTNLAQAGRRKQAIAEGDLKKMREISDKNEAKQTNIAIRDRSGAVIRDYESKRNLAVAAEARNQGIDITKDKTAKALLEKDYDKAHRPEADRYNVAVKQYGGATAKMADEAKEIGAPLESTFDQIEKLYNQRAAYLSKGYKIDSKEVRDIDNDLVGQLIYANGKISNSPEGSKWKEAMAKFKDADSGRWDTLRASATDAEKGLQLPPWFGSNSVLKDENTITSGDYTTLATEQARATQADSAFQQASNAVTNHNVAGARLGREIDLDIKSTSEDTLKLITSDDPDSQSVRARLGGVQNITELESLLGRLPEKVRKEIDSIQSRTDLSPQDKGNLIDDLLAKQTTLSQNTPTNPTLVQDRAELAQALGLGLKLTDAGKAHRISADVNHNTNLKTLIQTEVRQMSELRDAQASTKTAQSKVDAGTPTKPSYVQAVTTLKTATTQVAPAAAAGKTNEAWLRDETKTIKEEIMKLIANSKDADLSLDQLIATAGHNSTLTPQQMADFVDGLKLQGIKPGKDITTAQGAGANLTGTDIMNLVLNTEKADK